MIDLPARYSLSPAIHEERSRGAMHVERRHRPQAFAKAIAAGVIWPQEVLLETQAWCSHVKSKALLDSL